MRYRYNAKADILILKFSRDRPDFGEQSGNVITHYNKKERIVEIEILDARRTAKKIISAITKATRHAMRQS